MEIASNSSFSSQIKELKASHNKETNGSFGAEVSEAAHARNEARKNAEMAVSADKQIIESTFKSTASAKPMAILSRETIDHVINSLNEHFEQATFAIDDIQAAYDNGLDVSPEATADRIVSMSTAFFAAYREQHTELSDKEASESFINLIGGAIDQGFTEAREILGNLNILEEGDIASNIDITYDFVQQGLASFLDSFNETEKEMLPPDNN